MHRNAVLRTLLHALWHQYLSRNNYAKTYNDLVIERGGTVSNDHIAFRTLNSPRYQDPTGAELIARIFTPLGYHQKAQYDFPNKHLTAWHFEHEKSQMPKIFISQLELDQLPPTIADHINQSIMDSPDPLTSMDMELLEAIGQGEDMDKQTIKTLDHSLLTYFSRHWQPPKRSIIEEVNNVTPYGAWVLLFGYAVNHFTAYINEQGIKQWPDIESTIDALKQAGVPMKKDIEGVPGSKLRQSSTEAVIEQCQVTEEDGAIGNIDWKYAYYELAERGMITDSSGEETLFTGFLGEQATHLFDMTNKEVE